MSNEFPYFTRVEFRSRPHQVSGMGADGQRCSSVAQLISCTLLLVSISPTLPLISTAPRVKQMGLPWHGEAHRALLRPRTGSNNWKWRHGGQRSLLCTGNQVGTSAASLFQTFRPPGLRVLAHKEDILQAHAIVLLPEHISHHVVKVRKAKVGHGLRVFNPRCGEWFAHPNYLPRTVHRGMGDLLPCG